MIDVVILLSSSPFICDTFINLFTQHGYVNNLVKLNVWYVIVSSFVFITASKLYSCVCVYLYLYVHILSLSFFLILFQVKYNAISNASPVIESFQWLLFRKNRKTHSVTVTLLSIVVMNFYSSCTHFHFHLCL